jgi:formylglycine-generating enzyme required for sulfatase activity
VNRDKEQPRRLRVLAIVGVLAIGIVGLIVWPNQAWLREQGRWYVTIRPYLTTQVAPHVLSAERERSLKPGEMFKECADDKLCPEMVVVPAGEFVMGSPARENGRQADEGPQHKVTLAQPFAVSRLEITFEQWDACVIYGDCDPHISDGVYGRAYGRGRQPAINIAWEDAQRYLACWRG